MTTGARPPTADPSLLGGQHGRPQRSHRTRAGPPGTVLIDTIPSARSSTRPSPAAGRPPARLIHRVHAPASGRAASSAAREPDRHQQRGQAEREHQQIEEAQHRAARRGDKGQHRGEAGRRQGAATRPEVAPMSEDAPVGAARQPGRPSAASRAGAFTVKTSKQGQTEHQQQVAHAGVGPGTGAHRAEQGAGEAGDAVRGASRPARAQRRTSASAATAAPARAPGGTRPRRGSRR